MGAGRKHLCEVLLGRPVSNHGARIEASKQSAQKPCNLSGRAYKERVE